PKVSDGPSRDWPTGRSRIFFPRVRVAISAVLATQAPEIIGRSWAPTRGMNIFSPGAPKSARSYSRMSNTSNLVLPYLAVGQAQKHVTVNESLRKLDAILQLSVVSATTAAQPASPADGAVYILPPGKT